MKHFALVIAVAVLLFRSASAQAQRPTLDSIILSSDRSVRRTPATISPFEHKRIRPSQYLF